jgi:hypothetical protein
VASDEPAGLASRSRAAHPLETEVRVVGAQRAGAGESRVGQRPQRQREELLVDGMGHVVLPVVGPPIMPSGQ